MKKVQRQADRLQAVALAYAEGSGAPRVAAKGRGLLAEKIIDKAKEAGVFVHESPELVSLLLQVDLDQHIPPQLYRAVAELLAFVYLLEKGAAPDSPDLTALLPAGDDAQANSPPSIAE
ncbi:EscU/YscU/HrcU family type III secretion system export apparatus switch protein [Chitinilyticum piscinae]|uniref:EscU/YscU/HrcU family type III secretion system export apparatus switch protein n=1 Tax=Chitinilyticum piscinae TaxID=2866724 RepID=A0A8J7FGP5_9NEIS|nr:EscU/YscU/HrcU family type III secretion system export apparatus switch protein [Chitinilyticum piscinae]MBE9608830.1 EscU/YscU/HrcU family type III secretion system export apparatus switch protein [Chitinilyticum piscinae]